ncbi:MAG: hypothetical protein AB8B82_08280 [Roseovarius sp.]
MSVQSPFPGGAPVGYVSELDATRAAAVLYLRLWREGDAGRSQINHDWTLALGADAGQRAQDSFDALCDICQTHARRPLMRHAVMCNCLGADEACFANFIATAAEGAREDAMLMATLLVRPDMAPLVTELAARFGLMLKRMRLAQCRATAQSPDRPMTLH